MNWLLFLVVKRAIPEKLQQMTNPQRELMAKHQRTKEFKGCLKIVHGGQAEHRTKK